MKLQVIACDIDKKFPAKTYTITVSDGRSISKDLCQEHAEPFEEWLEEVELDGDPGPEPEPESEPVTKVAAKKTTAKKAVAKKAAPSRRRPKVVTLDEIEKMKQG